MENDAIMDMDDMEEIFDTIQMTDDEGNAVEFTIIDGVEVEGTSYLLVIETENLENDTSEASILKETAEDGENLIYEFIDDDDEFEKIAAIFQENEEGYEIEL